ncbi:hypothetical protein GCM10027047_28020 [Rhodococcus aerolatus]
MTEPGAGGMHLAADDVAGAAARLRDSADAVARAGAALRSVATGPAATGPRYRAEGTRVAAGISAVDDALGDWSRHTGAMARALTEVSAGLRTADEDAAAGLHRVETAGERPGG